MAALTHPEARALIQAEADQLLSGAQSRDLNDHLRTCPECRAYRAELAAVATALPRAFQARWGGGPQSATATLAGVLAGARPRPAGPAGRLGLNRLGLATGLLSLLIVTGAAAAMTLRDQSGSFAGLFGLASEQTATATEPGEHPAASATPGECRERCGDQTPTASATRRECGDDCATRVSEPSRTPTNTPHEPEQTRTPHEPEASRTPEPTRTATNTRPPEASRTPRPTVNEPSRTPTNTPHEPEASNTPHEPEASSTPHEPEHTATPSATPHEPEHTATPTKTHAPEPSRTPTNTPHEPEHTATPTKTHVPEPSRTPTPSATPHEPEHTATPSSTPHEPEPTATKTPGAEPTATSTQI